MGIDYSYNCTKVSNVRPLPAKNGKRLFLADLEFEDEHGHALAPAKDVLVAVEGERVSMPDVPEDILDGDEPDSEWTYYEKLVENNPGWDFYNPEWVFDQLPKQP